MCRTGKVSYPSATAAYRFIGKKGTRQRAYQCGECGAWHTTSKYQPATTKEYKRRKMELREAA